MRCASATPRAIAPRPRAAAPPCRRAALRPAESGRRGGGARARRAAPRAENKVVVAGDVGGTNARWQLYSGDTLLFDRRYPTASHTTLEKSLGAFLEEAATAGHDGRPEAACVAAAGPVAQDRCEMTNLGWTVDARALEEAFGLSRARVVNDFEAAGYGVAAIAAKLGEVADAAEAECIEINAGESGRGPHAPLAVLGPGTGLGMCLLVWDEASSSYRVVPGEGGHATFAPRGDKQRLLQEYVEQRDGFCELESLLCGRGLVTIYEFLRAEVGLEGTDEAPDKEPADVTAAALARDCELCEQAVDMFLEMLGAEAGHMALRSLAGGVFVIGGIAPRLRERVLANLAEDTEERSHLLDGFLYGANSKFSPILKATPLHIVTDGDVGLHGAALVARAALSSV